MGIITLDDLKLYLALAATDESKDSQLQFIVNFSNRSMEKMCNRIFDEVTLTNEEYDGTDSTILYLKRIPITAVSSLKYGYPETIPLVTIDSSWYGFGSDYIYTDGRSGLVFTINPKYWKVTYTGGYKQAQMPEDLVLVTCELGALAYKDQTGRLGIISDALGGEISTTFTRELSISDQSVIEKYKRVAVA